MVVVPLYSEGKVIGFYGVDNLPQQSIKYAANMLQIMGHFIVSCIKRRNVVRELQQMSYCDQLTGLGNRYAMNEYMERIEEKESIGVVFCDITSLKKVNDEEGHVAGDQKGEMEQRKVLMAIGAVWEEEGKNRINKLLNHAESQMYADKWAYYNDRGIDRRK